MSKNKRSAKQAVKESGRDAENGQPPDDDGQEDELVELAMVGEVNEHEAEITEKLLQIPPGGECIIYFDSPGGSPYTALSLMTLIALRDLQATGVVTAECSSAALWPFAACRRRLVTPFSVLLFHPMKWQSEEHIGMPEASEWARHFAKLESEMDQLLADFLCAPLKKIEPWIHPGRYVSGREFAQAGFAELINLEPLDKALERSSGANLSPKKKRTIKASPKTSRNT